MFIFLVCIGESIRKLWKISHPVERRIKKTELYDDLKKSVRSPTTLTELNELSIEHYMEAPSAEQ